MTTTAQIIAEQIGNRTFAMLGAHSLSSMGMKDALSFKVRGSKKCWAIKVTYESGTDLYTVEGWNRAVASIGRQEGVHVEELRQTIGELTGLATSL